MTRVVHAYDLPTEWHNGRLYAIVPGRMIVVFDGRDYPFRGAGMLWINPPRVGEHPKED